MLGEDEFLLRAPFDVFKLRVERFRAPRGDRERALARAASFALRVGVEHGDPEAEKAALGLERALEASGGFALDLAPRLFTPRQLAAVTARVVEAIEAGRIAVTREELASLSERPFELDIELPPLPPPPKEGDTTFFELRLVDEVGQAISGVGVEFKVDGELLDATTNAAGVALLDGVKASSAEARVAEPSELEKALDPRWSKPRQGKPPKEANTTRLQFTGAPVGPLGVKAAVPNTVVLEPPRGRLLVQLFDKTGRHRHAQLPYVIEGPEPFSGTTDDSGTLTHELVFLGDYTLKFTLEFFEGKDKKSDDYQSPLVVLSPSDATPEIRKLGVVPRSVLAQAHAFFNTNKAFLLPTALPSLRELRALYLESTPGKLLVVGHADTKGGAAFNDQLSLERAKATIAYLKDDVDAWLAFYELGVPEKKRWGKVEDRLMLTSMPDFRSKPQKEDGVTWFQRTRKLQIDGKAGPETRRQLVTEYMGLDGVVLEELAPGIEMIAHGCGENFPLDAAGENLDAAPEDEKRDPGDRRVELFFFDSEFGIVPAPPGENSQPGSEEYPAWRKGVSRIIDLEAGELDGPSLIFVELFDTLFRTDSAVVLPEGEAPSAEEHESLTAVGVFATVLRFIEKQGQRKLLIAGHTDTTGEVAYNQKLSKERAECALALLTGDRKLFQDTCQARHTVADYKQILAWVSRAFSASGLDFPCDPGKIDDNAATGEAPVRKFQEAYNLNRAELAVGPREPIAVDGDVGKETWGAFYDCYESALQTELAVDTEGLSELRKALVFVDDQRKALGFGEHFPIEELGVDNFKSQLNRRVELLTFQPGEEPDVEHAEKDPETSEIYLPGLYRRERVDRPGTGLFVAPAIGVRVPTRFSVNKSFPKPSAVPALKAALALLEERPELRLVIVGHADPTGSDPDNHATSLARAEAIRAWLLGDTAFFEQQFANDDPRRGWDWEEIQWMLYALKAGDSPCYIGQADGFPGDRTEEALGSFQLTTEDLAVSYAADALTVERLISEYVGLVAGTFKDATRIEVVGGGSWHPPVQFEGGKELPEEIELPDLRRVELFLFSEEPRPPVAKFPTSRATPTVYLRWCAQVGEELTPEATDFHVEAYDAEGLPLGNVTLQVAQIVDDEKRVPFGSLATNSRGIAAAKLPPGLYVAQLQQGGGEALVASAVVDLDGSCGAALSFGNSSGLDPLASE